MAYPDVQPSSARVWTLAARQHGVIARSQLLALGYSAQAIKRRVASGRLHPVWRGVYAVGRPQMSQHGVWMAAVLTCGHGAVLSHGSAAAFLEILPREAGAIHVSVSARVARRGRPGIAVHRRAGLAAHDLAEHRGIPVTSPARTLVDLATCLDREKLERAIAEADKRDLIDPAWLRRELGRFAGQPGVAALRETLDRHTFTLTDSELERRFLPLARQAGLPSPLAQHYLNGFRVDFYWPELRLVVETDGLRYHRTPTQQAKDRLRDQTHAAAGLTPLRFTYAQVTYDPDHVRRTLAAVAARLRGAA
jgi:very-short-patch-repair endonuclease/predicted transcriptional regulator of viral defense system